MRRRLRQVDVDTRTLGRDSPDEIRTWLGADWLASDAATVTVRNGDGERVTARRGWTLVRWPTGELTVSSPTSARLVYGVEMETETAVTE